MVMVEIQFVIVRAAELELYKAVILDIPGGPHQHSRVPAVKSHTESRLRASLILFSLNFGLVVSLFFFCRPSLLQLPRSGILYLALFNFLEMLHLT